MIKLRLWRSWKAEGWWQSNRESITAPASSKTWQIQPCCSGFSVMNRKAYWDIWWRLGGISGDYKETSITEIRIFWGKRKFLRAKRSLVPDRHMHHASSFTQEHRFWSPEVVTHRSWGLSTICQERPLTKLQLIALVTVDSLGLQNKFMQKHLGLTSWGEHMRCNLWSLVTVEVPRVLKMTALCDDQQDPRVL